MTVELVEVPCPICGSPEREETRRAPDHTGTVPGEFRLVRCLDCSLEYLCPRPRPETLALCYADDYGPHREEGHRRERRLSLADRVVLRRAFGWPFDGRRSRAPRWLVRLLRRRFAANRRNLRFVPFEGSGRLLDLGCGSGRWLQLHAEGGFDARGVEIDPRAVAKARARGLRVHEGTVRDAPFSPESFDIVAMTHVLEHVPDPVETLDRVRELLAPGGLLLLSAPVSDGHAAERLGVSWYYLELPRHLLHFTRARLLAFLGERGFAVERVRDDPAGDGWRWSARSAPPRLAEEAWFRRLATDKRHRRRFSEALAREGRSSFVTVDARRTG